MAHILKWRLVIKKLCATLNYSNILILQVKMQ